MKNFLASISIVLLFCAASCATLGLGNPGFVAFGACTTQNLEAAGKTLMNDISAAFATGGYEAEVAKLITQSGYAEVQCGIDLFISEMSGKKTLAPSGSVALTNAKAYRAAHPITN